MITTQFVYQFVGGTLNGQTLTHEQAEAISIGESPNYTLERAMGRLVPRAELDEQPRIPGYVGPMWDGTRNTSFGLVGVIRYETQEVYNTLSN